ncbi:MAG: hypothetical protein ACUVQ8_06945 [Nitrososphaeria archaeon]
MLDNIDDEDKKILLALAFAKGAAPLKYISAYTGIKEPIKILEKMEKVGLVRRSRSSDWSHSVNFMFEITPQARKQLLCDDLISIIESPTTSKVFEAESLDAAYIVYDE